MTAMPAQPGGPTAIVVPVPEAESAVGRWRERHDPSARQGMPAHITVLYPFLPEVEITAEDADRLAQLFARQAAFDVTLVGCARFPAAVLYLDPRPAQPLRALTAAVATAWPRTPPYGGAFDDVVPHLTVAIDVDPATANQIQTHVNAQLPISAAVHEAWQYVPDGVRWVRRRRLPLRTP